MRAKTTCQVERATMRFLLTNDDGPDVAGLAVLQRAVAELGESVIVVPRDGTASSGLPIGNTWRTACPRIACVWR